MFLFWIMSSITIIYITLLYASYYLYIMHVQLDTLVQRKIPILLTRYTLLQATIAANGYCRMATYRMITGSPTDVCYIIIRKRLLLSMTHSSCFDSFAFSISLSLSLSIYICISQYLSISLFISLTPSFSISY